MPSQCPQLNFKLEADRYKTFGSWLIPFIDPRKLAAAGFYYSNRDGCVMCAFCHVKVTNWEQGDDPFQVHQSVRPSCPFILNMPVGNIPLSGNTDTASGRSNICEASGSSEMVILPGPSRNCANNFTGGSIIVKQGINSTGGHVFPQYALAEERAKSFNDWPMYIGLHPEKLTDAGFFYTGLSDRTVCFHCGGGLRNWKGSDDPWLEHAKWYPKCSYVLLNKGEEFVASVSVEMTIRRLSKELENLLIPAELKKSVQIKEHKGPSNSSSEPEPDELTSSFTTQENEETNRCEICHQEEVGIVFLPCGHMVACIKCAPSVTKCPVCRQPFHAIVRAYRS